MHLKQAARHTRVVLAASVVLAAGAPAAAQAGPTFNTYVAPAPLGQDAGEPSIGVDRATGKVLYQAGLETERVDLDATPAPTWKNVGATLTSLTTLDPILATDARTNRTFVSQLAGACSLLAYTDDDGASFTQNPLGCGLASGADHQTIGGGPFATGLTGVGVGYPDATYYCAQAVATAQCSLSQDGGLTFNPAVPIYNAAQCGGLHGHIKVAPDGTAYVPNADCGGRQGFSVSKDNGTTWSVKTILQSASQDESDPSVGIGSGGTAYLGFADAHGTGQAGAPLESRPSVSIYKPATGAFSAPVDVSGGTIKNTQFPTMVAGNDNRAAIAFLGTTTGGDDQAATFDGVWHLYVATTMDGGTTWSMGDATPGDPVQRGCIWLGGGSNPCRNMLDFMDATIDKSGRVLVGYADGCTGACVTGGRNGHTAIATIARQSSGPGLLSAYDTAAPAVVTATTAKRLRAPRTQTIRGTYAGGPARVRPREAKAELERELATTVEVGRRP
jgi:hypothetical protein